jgi:cytochrome c-type biogenesis protein CcmH
MTAFLVVATLLALGAAALLLVPLLRPRPDGVPRAPIAALLTGALVLAGAGVLYPVWSTWSWDKPIDDVATPEGMVGRLARRLERNPEDLNGWLLLGRSYGQLGQFSLSAKAYRRADVIAKGGSADALSGLAEALVLGEQSDLKGEAGRLFEKALQVEPRSVKALFYGALAAAERGDGDLARSRFQQLLTADTPPDVRRLIEQQIAALDVELQQRDAGSANVPAADSEAAAATLRLRVEIDPSVAARATPGAPLFVSVRLAGQGGPPLAAKRLEARFPQDVQLGAGDAMIAGRTFAAGQEVEITARVANGGSAAARSGDPVGTVRHRIGDGGTEPLRLRIGALTP